MGRDLGHVASTARAGQQPPKQPKPVFPMGTPPKPPVAPVDCGESRRKLSAVFASARAPTPNPPKRSVQGRRSSAHSPSVARLGEERGLRPVSSEPMMLVSPPRVPVRKAGASDASSTTADTSSQRSSSSTAAASDVAAKICATQSLEAVADFAEEATADVVTWLIWLVHRVYLNDPELTKLVFANFPIPSAEAESRIYPKLVKSLGHNTCLTHLSLNNCGLRGGEEALILAESLKTNSSLQHLEIESNHFDQTDLQLLFMALASNTGIEALRCGHQFSYRAGYGLFSSIDAALRTNNVLRKLGIHIPDPHWRNEIHRHLQRNFQEHKKLLRDKKAADKSDNTPKTPPKRTGSGLRKQSISFSNSMLEEEAAEVADLTTTPASVRSIGEAPENMPLPFQGGCTLPGTLRGWVKPTN